MRRVAVMKRFDCGHREFSGHSTSIAGPEDMCGCIALACVGPCTQCLSDGTPINEIQDYPLKQVAK